MLNALMRFGKTPIITKFLDENKYKKIVIITDQANKGYLRLLPDTNLILDKNIYFLNSS